MSACSEKPSSIAQLFLGGLGDEVQLILDVEEEVLPRLHHEIGVVFGSAPRVISDELEEVAEDPEDLPRIRTAFRQAPHALAREETRLLEFPAGRPGHR
ncbi:MAG: hypothetical protein ACT4TC_02915 [Myxococcaceae bacterium]